MDKVYLQNVVFLFSGPNRGHYIAIVKSHDFWLLFDDDIVEVSDFICNSLTRSLQLQMFFSNSAVYSCRKLMHRP